MPSSSQRGKSWIINKVLEIAKTHKIETVWDIGAGNGTYSKLLKKNFPNSHWTAFEIWDPYIKKYDLKSKYNTVITNDARLIDFGIYPKANLAFAGDVLEHMTKEEAVKLVNHILTHCEHLVISIPIIYYEQGPYEGNPYEVHVKPDWSDKEFIETFKDFIIDNAVDEEIGVYLLSKKKKESEINRKLKIAIYTIAKNEENFVERWANSNSEADIRIVCDTGSTDNTVEKLKEQGVTTYNISVIPWRFDDARNTALNLVPRDVDVCIWQDLDEALLPGWREQLEKNWDANATIANHRYRNNRHPWQWHSKIHARLNCIWTGAVHETLKWFVTEKAIWIPEIYLDEKQDTSKDRKSYIKLLEKKIAEGDKQWRTYYFLANDQHGENMIDDAIKSREQSYLLCDEGEIVKSYIARNIAINYAAKLDYVNADLWFRIALQHGNERETWYAVADYHYKKKEWDQCFLAATRCLSITQRRDGFTQDPAAWGMIVYDYAAMSAYYMGLYNKALEYGQAACDLEPDNERLKTNLKFYQEKTQ
jgi:glycosyltransferase involved in cell wall biosynthesis